jgi:ABC-type dipeptide/oligopeptide/nickel transport system permease subunit
VNELIRESFPVSAELALWSLLIALSLGLPAGILASLRPNTASDYIPSSLAMAGISVPNFVIGPVLVLVFALKLEWVRVSGWDEPIDRILPSITLGLLYAAYIARLTRGGMLEILSQDFIRTARAKGASHLRVILKHALRGGLVPVVSYLGPAVAGLVTGSFVVESIFPGAGPRPLLRERRFQPRLHNGARRGALLRRADRHLQPDRRRHPRLDGSEAEIRMSLAVEIPNEPVEQGTSLWKDAWHRLAKNKLAVAGAILLLLLALASFLGPLVLSHSYETQNLQLGATPPSV